jgi:hypothetical protein
MIAGFWIEVLEPCAGRPLRTYLSSCRRPLPLLAPPFHAVRDLSPGGPHGSLTLGSLLQTSPEAVVTRARRRQKLPGAFAVHPKD